MPTNLQDIGKGIKDKKISRVVSCPIESMEIPGITAADAFDALDCFGDLFVVKVPKSGEIRSATFWDLDDEGTEIDFIIFKHQIVDTGSDAAWAPSDADMLKFVTQLDFVSFEDHINSKTSEITNIGKAYTAPEGKFWIQAKCVGTPNIAAGHMPRFQLDIMPDDPDWVQ